MKYRIRTIAGEEARNTNFANDKKAAIETAKNEIKDFKQNGYPDTYCEIIPIDQDWKYPDEDFLCLTQDCDGFFMTAMMKVSELGTRISMYDFKELQDEEDGMEQTDD